MNKLLFLSLICLNSLFSLTESIHAKKLVDIKGDGNVITKEIPIAEYSQIKLEANINEENGNPLATEKEPQFKYSQTAGSSSLQITTDKNLLSHLDIRVSDDCLIISTKNNERLLPTYLEINSQSPQLEKADIGGSFHFELQTELQAEKLESIVSGIANVHYNKPVHVNTICKILVSGVAKMEVKDMTCQRINAEMDGAGNLKLKGKAQTGKYNVRGASNLKAYDFILENLECKVSDSGTAKAHVTEILKAQVSSAGTLKYNGFPRTDIQETEAGRIIRVK